MAKVWKAATRATAENDKARPGRLWRLGGSCLAAMLMFVPSLQVAAAEVSGTFVGGSRDFVAILQILPTGEGKIVGRLRTASFDAKGKKQALDRPVSGAASSDSFVGKLEGNWDNGGTVAVSGSLANGALNISAANGLNVTLRRGDEQEFNRLVEQLASKSNDMQQQNAQRESARKAQDAATTAALRIRALRSDIGAFAATESKTVEEKAIAAGEFKGLTQQLRDKVEQLEQITESGLPAVTKRYQLQTVMSQIDIAVLGVAKNVFDAQRNFDAQAARLRAGIEEASRVCGVPGGPAMLRDECALMPSSSAAFDQVRKRVGDGYQILMNARQKTKVEQRELHDRASAFMAQYQQRR